MATDREHVYHRAEELVRQGRLDAAIDEYQRIVGDHPTDWTGANTLGDLLVRAGQIDKAIVQYTRIGDHLAREGFFPKAVALYKKILKFNPDNEYALIQTAEVTARQGLLAAAKAHLARVVERRLARGDGPGAAEMRARIGLLDPSDLDARIAGARATAEMGRPVDGARLLVAIGLEVQGRGRQDMTFDLLSEAAALAPDDDDVQRHAAAMRSVRMQQALERGDLPAAREHLSSVTIGSDPEWRLLAAELDLRSGEYGSGRETLRHLLVDAPEMGERVRELSHTLAETDPEAAFACADSLAVDAIDHEDWTEAARVLRDFLVKAPRHIPALMRLIDVSIDGGALDRLHAAQAQLADAYLECGRVEEARVIAEDLALSAPWERVDVERWRRALALAGEPDPDRVIVDKLSDASAGPDADSEAESDTQPDTLQQPTDPRFQLSANAIDVQAILSGELDDAAARVMHLEQVELVEVDLSAAIEGLSDGQDIGAGGDMDEPQKDPRGLDGVFEDFRSEVSRQDSADAAGQHVKLAVTYQDMGLIDEAIGALQAAARSPRYRFEASAMLGRLLQQRGKLSDAIEWFERAAEAPAATADEGRALLYDLAKALEASGEIARALAVYLEIQTDKPGYRDVAARVEHLSRLQSQG